MKIGPLARRLPIWCRVLAGIMLCVQSTLGVDLGSEAFDLSDVRLLDSRFKEMQDLQRTGAGTIGYLTWLDPDRLLYDFRNQAGVTQPAGATSYGGWEDPNTGFVRGHFAGHYLSAASRMYAATGDVSYLTKINSVVTGMAQCQTALNQGGYLSAFPSTWFDTLESGGNASVPYYTIHKIMAGLVDAYQYTGNNQALNVAEGMSDYFAGRIAKLTPAQIDTMLHTDTNQQREFGSMNEVLTDLYVMSSARGDANAQRFLTLANTFNRSWFVDPLVNGEDKLSGLHANTHIAQAVGLARYANVAGDARTGQAAANFWNPVVRQHSFANGGNSFAERFQNPGVETGLNGANLTATTAETCNVYNMLKLTSYLMQSSPKAEYGAYYEQALYNQILPSIAPDTGLVTYFQSLKPGHFKTYGTPEGACWCCQGTGLENRARFNESVYFHKNDDLWVNLFMPSQVNWTEKGITLQQTGEISISNTVQFSITTASATQANLNIRVPSWTDGDVTVRINGQAYTGPMVRGQYLNLDRQWQNGDQVELTMPKKLYIRRSMDDPTMVSIFYGPIMLAGRLGTSGMPASDQATDQSAYNGYSDPAVSAVTALSADPSQWLQLVDPNTLTFQTVNAGAASGITFSPYYDVNHQRYSVYWKLNAPSATRTWRGGGTFADWNDPTNWDVAPGTNDSLQFSGSLSTTANNNLVANSQFNGIAFTSNAGAFNISGNSFTLGGNIVNNSSNLQTINTPIVLAGGARTFNAAAADITARGSISGPGSLIKTGSHILNLSGSSVSLAGGTTVQQGTLCYNYTSISGDVTNQGTVIFNQTQDGSMSGKILGSGNMVKTGSASLALLDVSSYIGSTAIEQGTLRLQAVRVPTLAHRWSFNNSLNDSVGGSNASIVDVGSNNATLSSTQVTLAGGTRSTSDYVSLGSNLLPNNANPITIELWATQQSAKNWSRIFDFGSSTAENLFMSWTQGTSANTDRVEWVDSAGKTTADNTNAPYTLGQEYHIVMVIQPDAGQGGNTRVTWYSAPSATGMIGLMKGSFDTPNTLAQLTDGNDWLGRSQYGDDTANANFNEVRIWQDALTNAELQILHGWGPDHSLGPESFAGHGQLPATTSLNISAGASLDMNGFNQTVGSLSGTAGSSILLGSGTLTVGGDNTSSLFSGAILGSGNITKTGKGVLTLDGILPSIGSISIMGGSLQLNSSSASVHNITGGALIVGDGLSVASLTADSITGDTLTIAAGAILTIRPIPGGPSSGPLQPVPEPACIIMLILAGSILFAARRKKRSSWVSD
jgi:uncharacterized protein